MLIELRCHYKRQYRNKYRILLLAESGRHQPIFLDCLLNSNLMTKGSVLVNETTKLPMDILPQVETLKQYAKENELLLFQDPAFPRVFNLKKIKNKTLYGGYRTELKTRMKFYLDPITRMNNIIRSNRNIEVSEIKTTEFKRPILSNDNIEYVVIDTLKHFNFLKKLLAAVDKPTISISKFSNEKIMVMVEINNLNYYFTIR